ncbi:MAG: hypothetical protein JW996_05005 [Candidatus Cloacimonetes bacterium]|nr:hypothetical protein [Candidatus Cloacimonadota bacterium]
MKDFNKRELKLIKELLSWDKSRKSTEVIFFNILLFLGMVLIIFSTYYYVRYIKDQFILWISLPGFLSGLLFVWFYIIGRKRFSEKEKLAELLQKLLAEKKPE